jgi:probable DNA metabolism protein
LTLFVIYDGSFSGLLTAVAWCLRRQCIPDGLLSDSDQMPLIDAVTLPTEKGIRSLFNRHFQSMLGNEQAGLVLDTAYRAWLSEMPEMGSSIRGYLSAALRERCDPSGRLTDPHIAAVVGAARKVSGQAHQYLGLLRFRRAGPSLYLADFTPDYHVLPLILPHFADRLADQEFVICDRRRNIAAWHHAPRACADGPIDPRHRCTLHWLSVDDQTTAACMAGAVSEGLVQANRAMIAAGDPPDDAPTSLAGTRPVVHEVDVVADREDYEAMWRLYLSRLTIPERRNLFLQRGNLPLKYRTFMTEFNHGG